MASKTVSSYHPSTPERDENGTIEEVKTMEQEGFSPPKESEEKPKDEKPPSMAVPLAESDEKLEGKQCELPPLEEVAETDEEGKPKAEDSLTVEEVKTENQKAEVSPDVTDFASAPEENVEDKHTEDSEVNKSDYAPVVDASSGDNPEPAKEGMNHVSGMVNKNTESKPRDQRKIERSKSPTEESAKKTVDEKAEPLFEAVEKEELKEENLAAKEPEAAVIKDVETSEAEHKIEEISATVSVVGEKPEVQPANTEETQKESEVAEPKEETGVAVEKDEEISTDKIEDSKAMEVDEATPTESSDQVVEAKDVESAPAEVAEKAITENKEEELVKKIDNVEEPVKENIEVENEAKEVKTEEEKKEELIQSDTTEKIEEDKTQKTDSSTQPEKNELTEEEKGDKTEELSKPANGKVSEVTSLVEKAVEGENLFRDIEMVTENGSNKDETVAPIESKKEADVEKKVDEVIATTTTAAPLEKPQQPETEAKVDENVQPVESRVENEKEIDVRNIESNKDADDKGTLEVPAKTKQSNNILSKLKQSLVKAKKAIIGKSTNSKTQSTEDRE